MEVERKDDCSVDQADREIFDIGGKECWNGYSKNLGVRIGLSAKCVTLQVWIA